MDIEELKRRLLRRSNAIPGLVVVSLFVAAGYFAVHSGSAASFFAGGEAEGGELAGNAQTVQDAGASAGQTVLFGVPAGPGYYVDCVNGDDANDGTSSGSAWRSLSKLSATTLSAGETAYLARGCTFDGGMRLKGDGTAASNVVLDAYGSGSAPVVRNAASGEFSYGVIMEGSYQTVQNIMVKDTGGAGVSVTGSHGSVKNVEVAGSGEGVLVANGAPHAYIYKVYAHDLKMINNTPGGDDDWGAVGFDIEAPDAEVAYSKCVRCRAPSYDYGNDGGFVEIWQYADNLYAHHNWAEETDGFMEAGGDGGPDQHANNTRFAYNVLYNTGAVFTIHNGDNFSLPMSGVRFENNTVYQSADTDFPLFYSPDTDITVRNSIFSVSNQLGDVPAVHTNNIFHAIGGGPLDIALGATERDTDPLFVDAAAGDFHLQPGSPARGLGAGGLGYTTDYDGTAVPAVPDAGAFQFK